MAEPEGEEQGPAFLLRITRWAVGVRLALVLLVVLTLSGDLDREARVAVALLGLWSLLWVDPTGRFPALVRRHPAIAALDCLLVVAVTGTAGVDSPIVLALLTSALVVGVLFRPLAAALLTLVLVNAHLLLALVEPPEDGTGALTLFVLPATYVALAVLGSVVRSLHEQVVAEARDRVRSRVAEVASAERARLSREMHDSVAKSLHGISLAASALPTTIERDPGTARVRATQIAEAARTAADEARELLTALRTSEDGPLAERVGEVVDAFADAHPDLALDARISAVADLPSGVAHEVVRIVGEALENTARHADATRVDVELRDEQGHVVVRVADDGQGFDADRTHHGRFGLTGMRERAEQLGARLGVASGPGTGTVVELAVPRDVAAPASAGARSVDGREEEGA